MIENVDNIAWMDSIYLNKTAVEPVINAIYTSISIVCYKLIELFTKKEYSKLP